MYKPVITFFFVEKIITQVKQQFLTASLLLLMSFLALFHYSYPEYSISVFFPSYLATVIQFLPSLKRDSCVYGTRLTAQVTNRVEVWRLIYGADDRNKISLFTPSGMQNETITTSSKFTTREEKRGHEKKKGGLCG